MKPPKAYIISFLVIMGIILIFILIQSRARKNILSNNHNQIQFLIKEMEDLKEQFTGNPDETVTKADLTVFVELNRYQSEIDKLYLDNKMVLSGDYLDIFPNYVLIIFILLMSFQLDSIRKKIVKQSGPDKMGIE